MTPLTIVALAVLAIAVWGVQHVWRREYRRKQQEYHEMDTYEGPETPTKVHDNYDSDGRPL